MGNVENKNTRKKILGNSQRFWPVLMVGIILGALCTGLILDRASNDHDHKSVQEGLAKTKQLKDWTCSMHPQIKLSKKGLCPICGMELIPVYENSNDGSAESEVSISLNATGRNLAEIETEEVKYQSVTNEIRLVGKVEYDESKLSYISAWVPGRIDRLFVDFTGTKVRKGDHLIKLYSPELISAQEEYIQALKNWNDFEASELKVMRQTAETTLKSSQEKLRLLGITDEQINEIRAKGKPQEHVTIYSPSAGTVIHKNGFEGMYVKTGDKIYTIADLNNVWLYLDAYESDIQWLHYGQSVAVEAEGYPGEVFHGKVAFIDPFVSNKSRTIKLRVNIENTGQKLKPGMLVRTSIKSQLGDGGKIYQRSLAGKWICPMHPEIVKDNKDICDICEMDLIPTKEFGFADTPTLDKLAMTIPKTAPLITGKRAIVYIENINDKTGVHRYEGREIVLGPRAGDDYVVLAGLLPGEKVVTKGNFKIDSALQIQAKPSMMNTAGYYSETDNVISKTSVLSSESAGILIDALPQYLSATRALAQDDAHSASQGLKQFNLALQEVISNSHLFKDSDGIIIELREMQKSLANRTEEIGQLRQLLLKVSMHLKSILKKYEYTESLTLYLNFCPMAFSGQGGYWFQDSADIANPYYGAKMLKCGEVKHIYGRKITNAQSKGSHGHQH